MSRDAIFIHMSRTLRTMPISITVEEIEALVDRVIAAQPQNPRCFAYTIARREGIDRMRRTQAAMRRAAFLTKERREQRQKNKRLRLWKRERDAVLQIIEHLKRTIPPQRHHESRQRHLDVLACTLRENLDDAYPDTDKNLLYQWRSRGIVYLCKQSEQARRFYERYYADGRRFGLPPC